MLTAVSYINSACVPDGRHVNYVISSASVGTNPIGFVSSPNYPDKYYWNADCHWRLIAQRHQMIRITVIDFELDVRRDGVCHDEVKVIDSSLNHVVFNDCGALGKQTVDVSGNEAIVRFTTGQTGQTQRGFLIQFEGIGTIHSNT